MIAPWKPEFGDPAQVATIATYRGSAEHKDYYPGTEEAHTNPTRQRGECLRALAGTSG